MKDAMLILKIGWQEERRNGNGNGNADDVVILSTLHSLNTVRFFSQLFFPSRMPKMNKSKNRTPCLKSYWAHKWMSERMSEWVNECVSFEIYDEGEFRIEKPNMAMARQERCVQRVKEGNYFW